MEPGLDWTEDSLGWRDGAHWILDNQSYHNQRLHILGEQKKYGRVDLVDI